MNDRIKNTTTTMVRKNLSNKWFIVSVVTTISLIILLVWGLSHSSRTLESFEENGLAIEKASGELLLSTKELEMAVQMAAATGDLAWQESYNQTKPEVKAVLGRISKLINLEEASQKTEEINTYLEEINALEQKAFNLISRGEVEDAVKLVSGWEYTKNQIALTEATEELTHFTNDYISNQIAFEEKLTSYLLSSVFVLLILLILSWLVSIKHWKNNFMKIREKEDEITYLSYHDSLTGIYNRRYFDSELRRLDKEKQIPITIIICDANRLKELNDTLGHHVGDGLLIEIASILKEVVGKKGIVSRWGGDEFGIILPYTDSTAAKSMITDINNKCKQSNFEPETPSISIGFAVKTQLHQDINRTFTLAETRMYKKKNSLRNGKTRYKKRH
ncbi:diguanylate cyclase (GGDEF) domain-containing protein [Oceanobacillus limi]|uniref:Diguanylate cyclase (GGDEF) domain-containing protein n=1 Tax=Oceanobacillus limi TaxID=930131 RepID=A0A1I0CAP5_9BACI|nr:sensor domain-containing diguanylate cyclase [Oceanobacillus limi]SET16611.1 diguanylate cyclase (GGDEF) domain-containing protein [Oceanobacillus limi]